jgi:hypothetical protein
MAGIEVRRNEESARYEAFVDGALAGFAQFRPAGDVVVLPHTVVDDAFEGQGVGSALARGALDDLRARGVRVHATCPFISAWVAKHPDYQDLVMS